MQLHMITLYKNSTKSMLKSKTQTNFKRNSVHFSWCLCFTIIVNINVMACSYTKARIKVLTKLSQLTCIKKYLYFLYYSKPVE